MHSPQRYREGQSNLSYIITVREKKSQKPSAKPDGTRKALSSQWFPRLLRVFVTNFPAAGHAVYQRTYRMDEPATRPFPISPIPTPGEGRTISFFWISQEQGGFLHRQRLNGRTQPPRHTPPGHLSSQSRLRSRERGSVRTRDILVSKEKTISAQLC